MTTDFLVMILDPLKDVYHRFAALFPNLIAMMVIMLAGTVIAVILRSVLLRLLKAFNFNTWSDQMGVTSMLRKCDVWARPSDAVVIFMFWTRQALGPGRQNSFHYADRRDGP